ncbi:hypothetical protein CNMCM8980_005615 [Aspergillus fumigatiaffinis]|nr:hypothetical protein CNMCM8980_005615 [Aspergillus fumigatiaffinis]
MSSQKPTVRYAAAHVLSFSFAALMTGLLQFETYKARGLINIASASHVDNGIPLCALCHRNFDDLYSPGFVFIPTDIGYFKDYEERDKKRRLEHYNRHRTRLKRSCPSPEDYRQQQLRHNVIQADHHGGLYNRYTLRDYFPRFGCCRKSRTRTGELFPPAAWHGDPMAALRRGFAILGSVTLDGIPMGIRKALQELHNLYIETDELLARHGREDEESDDNSESRFELQDAVDGSVAPQSDTLQPQDSELETRSPESDFRTTSRAEYSASGSKDTPEISTNKQVAIAPTVSVCGSKSGQLVSVVGDSARGSLPGLDAQGSSLTSSDNLWSHSAGAREAKIHTLTKKNEGPWKWGPLATTKDLVEFYASVQNI